MAKKQKSKAPAPSPLPEDGIIQGVLDPFCETGTEGIVWSLLEDGKKGYDSLNCLEEGDLLKVFNDAARKELLWEGEIKLKYPPATRFNRGVQEGVNEDAWTRLFFDAKPATLIRKDLWKKMQADARRQAKAEENARKKALKDIETACHQGVDVKPMKPLNIQRRPKG